MDAAVTLRERRRQDTIDEIARAAVELFNRDGFGATSIEAIATAAGCSSRTFYRYFGSKEDVMFHDFPSTVEGIGEALDRHLAEGLDPWPAVTEALVESISRFDATDQRMATERMHLWLTEPALRVRYIQYVTRAEEVVVDSLCRHRGTTPETDEPAALIAVAAIGAYRVTILTHAPNGQNHRLAEHLRSALGRVTIADSPAG